MKNHRKIFAKRVRARRKKLGITIRGLVKKAKVPRSSICKYECPTDTRQPTLINIVRLAKALKVSTDYLLGLED